MQVGEMPGRRQHAVGCDFFGGYMYSSADFLLDRLRLELGFEVNYHLLKSRKPFQLGALHSQEVDAVLL